MSEPEVPTTEMAATTLAETPSSSSSSAAAAAAAAIWCEFSKRVPIKNIISRPDGGVGLAGERIKAAGWVKTGREQGKGSFAFLALNDGSCPGNLQVIVDSSVAQLSQITPTGTYVHAEGVLKQPPEGTAQKVELKVEKVLEIGGIEDSKEHPYPLPKAKISLEVLRKKNVHLRPRTNTISAVIRIRNALSYATHTFFQKHGFLYVQTPIITTIDCEGAGEMFQVTTLFSEADKLEKELKEKPGIPQKDGKIDYGSDFFEKQAFLTVSGQLQLESYACALSSVYTFGPTFRAEQSHTSRHLAEFWMVEPELACADLVDDMNCAEAYVKFLCRWLLDNCLDDMEFMVKNVDETAIDRLRLVSSTPFERITYTDAIALLEKKFQNAVEWGIDLASEHERYLTEVIFKKPVIVYNYPKGIKAFYMRLNDDEKTVAAMDVLVPKVGELIGGSQREERYDVIKERILEAGLPLDEYDWYLDLRRFGTAKHSGFGLGFERMVLFATGLDNIRDVIPFPRYPGKADR
ncbi:hypothetical protein MKW94_025847 [Papaver nudicaule]|uniref:asparagine--tRNA ligase n=1 Tax=Papaver nudicaule TaxID=74823 RepID=A0AA41V683_PAPNU|nr:hypothetical protein [Papaver nudicaule]